MKDVFNLSISANCHLMKNSWENNGSVLIIIEISRVLLKRCTAKYKSRKNQDFSMSSVDTDYHGCESIFYKTFRKNKRNQLSKQFQKINQKADTTKLPF